MSKKFLFLIYICELTGTQVTEKIKLQISTKITIENVLKSIDNNKLFNATHT